MITDSLFTNLNLQDLHTPLALDNSSVQLQNTTFANNTAYISGGIAASSMTQLDVSNCSFFDNYASKTATQHCNAHGSPGSIMYCGQCAQQQLAGHCTNSMSIFCDYWAAECALLAAPDWSQQSCSAGQGGGAIAVQGSSMMCDSEQIECIISIANSTFINNTDSSAVWVAGNNFHLRVSGSSFMENSATTSGGAIDFEIPPSLNTWPLYVNITSYRFLNNQANNFGGAFHLTNANPSRAFACNVDSSVFTQNSVGNQGGALALLQSNLSIADSSFAGNNAVRNDSSADAISLSAVCNSPILQDNNNFASAQLTSSIFACLLSILGSNFTTNSALSTGGAIYTALDGFVISVSQSRFEGNQLLGDGATADADESLAARDAGGGTAVALYPYTLGVGLSRLLIISQTIFSDNTGASPQLPQAALATQQLACLAIQDNVFQNNTAATGGAPYVLVVDGTDDLCSGNVENLPPLPGLVLHGPPLFDPFLSKPDHKPNPDTSAAPVPFLALIVDIRTTEFSQNTAFSGSAGEIVDLAHSAF